MFANRKFRFSHEITVTSLIAAVFCYAMSYWQYQRYAFKLDYFQILERQQALGVQPLSPEDAPNQLYGTVRVQGELDFENEMVLLNRSKGNTSGVKVVTPVKIAGSDLHVLVDRGFLPYHLYHERRYEAWRPNASETIEGIVRPSVTPSFFFSPPAKRPGGEEGPGRWVRLEIETMAEQLPYPVLPVYLEQINPSGDALIYDKTEVLPASRHLNYAIQWASFATFGILFGLFLQFRPSNKAAGNNQLLTS